MNQTSRRLRDPTTKILRWPDGRWRLITLTNWYWDAIIWLTEVHGAWPFDHILYRVYDLAERAHLYYPEFDTFEDELRDEFEQYLRSVMNRYIAEADGLANENFPEPDWQTVYRDR